MSSLPKPSTGYPTWQPDGTLLALAKGDAGLRIVRVCSAASIEVIATLAAPATDFLAFQVTRDGRTAAVLMNDMLSTNWWAGRSRD